MNRSAVPDHPIHDLLTRRWSPRAFADRAIEPDKIRRLFEAARWAASAFNEQPWRFIIATRDQPEAFQKVLACLTEGNQPWASSAPLLILTLARHSFTKNGRLNRVHIHDVGLAMGNLTVQATAMDLFVHQMAGVELDKVREAFNVPTDFDPVTAAAVGYLGDSGQLAEGWMRDAETAPRTRKPLSEIVFTGTFGDPAPLF